MGGVPLSPPLQLLLYTHLLSLLILRLCLSASPPEGHFLSPSLSLSTVLLSLFLFLFLFPGATVSEGETEDRSGQGPGLPDNTWEACSDRCGSVGWARPAQ